MTLPSGTSCSVCMSSEEGEINMMDLPAVSKSQIRLAEVTQPSLALLCFQAQGVLKETCLVLQGAHIIWLDNGEKRFVKEIWLLDRLQIQFIPPNYQGWWESRILSCLCVHICRDLQPSHEVSFWCSLCYKYCHVTLIQFLFLDKIHAGIGHLWWPLTNNTAVFGWLAPQREQAIRTYPTSSHTLWHLVSSHFRFSPPCTVLINSILLGRLFHKTLECDSGELCLFNAQLY